MKKIILTFIVLISFQLTSDAAFIQITYGGGIIIKISNWNCTDPMAYGFTSTIDGVSTHIPPSQISNCTYVDCPINRIPVINKERGGKSIDLYHQFGSPQKLMLSVDGGIPIEVHIFSLSMDSSIGLSSTLNEESGLITVSYKILTIVEGLETMGPISTEVTLDLDDYLNSPFSSQPFAVSSNLAPIMSEAVPFGHRSYAFKDLVTEKVLTNMLLPTRIYNGVEITVDAFNNNDVYLRFGNERHLIDQKGFNNQYPFMSHKAQVSLNAQKTSLILYMRQYEILNGGPWLRIENPIYDTFIFPLVPFFEGRTIKSSLRSDAYSPIAMYPNPANESSTITWNKPLPNNGTLQVLDISGRIIQSEVLYEGSCSTTIQTSNLQSGTYLIQIVGNAYPLNTRLVVNH